MLPVLLLALPQEPLVVRHDIRLDPGKTYGPIQIAAGHVTVDGNGATIQGVADGPPTSYTGIGIQAAGVEGVTLRHVRVKGFELGLKLEDAAGWTIEDCDFSDNYHDPDFGWGENGERGGLLLRRCSRCTLRNNQAQRNWDACNLVQCDSCVLEHNDFSHCSNTCLKLTTSCRNEIRDNDLSYGLRISPGEVHARDSASLLIESGSDDNRFLRNDCSHGGDGIFVRVLNQWSSRRNLFEENDASYANNNAVESWAEENTWLRNTANHSSYGFWMGGSDKTVLIGNEAAWNGLPDGFHNSPHLPDSGHAGIVFLFGPGSHTLVQGNRLHDNNGAGLALVGDQESQGARWKAYHWVIQQNQIERNRWGIYAQYADWVDLAANGFAGNQEDVHSEDVSRWTVHDPHPEITAPPEVRLSPPRLPLRVRQAVAFDAGRSSDPAGLPLQYLWDFGDGAGASGARVTHSFEAPGYYRVGLTAGNGALCGLAWYDAYVVEDVDEIGTEGQAKAWSYADETNQSQVTFRDDRDGCISGKSSLYALAQPYSGFRLNLQYPAGKPLGLSLEGKSALVFWMRCRNPNLPSWQDLNPILTLYETPDVSLRLLPARDFLSSPSYSEGRDGWNYFVVPLAGNDDWKAEGNPLHRLNSLSFGFDSWGAPPLQIWLDGLALK